MAIKNKTLINDGSKKKNEEEETRRTVNSSAPVSRQKTVKTKNNTQSQAPNPAGVLPAASQRSFATPPQYDKKFLEYSVANSKAEPKEQTRSGLEYDVAHQQWLIDEAKKNGSNVTWNQGLARAGNRLGQNLLSVMGGSSVTTGETAADRALSALKGAGIGGGYLDKAQDIITGVTGEPVTSELTAIDRARENLKNSKIGRQNAYIDYHQSVKNARQGALDNWVTNNYQTRAMSSPDFTAYSKYDPNKGNDKDFDLVYEQVNGTRRYQNAALEDAAAGNPFRPRIDHNYSQLTNDERAVYNYYYNTGDKEKAKEYLDSIYPELEKRRYEADRQGCRNLPKVELQTNTIQENENLSYPNLKNENEKSPKTL